MSVELPAGEPSVWAEDVQVVMERLGATELPGEVAAEVRLISIPHTEPTGPTLYGATGANA